MAKSNQCRKVGEISGHSLNLILQEASSTNDIVSGAFTAVQSICSIRTRLAVFNKMQVQNVIGDLCCIRDL